MTTVEVGQPRPMPVHSRARAAPRQDLPPAASCLAPFVIFAVCLFVVYQVNRHNQIHDLIEAQTEVEHHFAAGGTDAVHAVAAAHAADDPGGAGSSSSNGSSSSLTDARGTAASLLGDSILDGDAIDCHVEQQAEYHGAVVLWGDKHLKESAADCCAACRLHVAQGCNIWVWCGARGGCGGEGNARPFGECWLKKAPVEELFERAIGRGHPGIAWTSGALYTRAQAEAAAALQRKAAEVEAARLKALRERDELPLVYLDVAIRREKVGRMEFVLFTDISPLAAECMRRMCTGEYSPRHTLKNATFYRIIDQFIDQTGVQVDSPLGGVFKDDPEGLKLKHDRKGLLSVANGGPNTNTGHFSILMGPAPHLNGHYVIFGELVSGWEVAEAVNRLSRGKRNNELLNSKDPVIIDAGQLRRGTPVPDAVIQAGLVR